MVPALTSFTVSRSADGIAMPKKNPYSVHPGILMMEQWVKTLPEKTGRSLDQWIQLVKREGPPTTSERRAWLKKDHQLGTNIAATIVERAEGRGEVEASAAAYLDAAPGLVEAMLPGQNRISAPSSMTSSLLGSPWEKTCESLPAGRSCPSIGITSSPR